MIDSLMANMEKAEQKKTYQGFNLRKDNYALLTMHRPANVDNPEVLQRNCLRIEIKLVA
jgi:UDP-N-acetylglucosamine 2-epimerase (non-hydrolysing)